MWLKILKIIPLMFDYFSLITSSVPCELLYGGCKYNLDQGYHPPILGYQNYYNRYPQQQLFLPAPPGKVPRCAKPGSTFCEKIDRYPGDLIHALVTKTRYNYRSLFADESGEGFDRKASNQGFVQGSVGYTQSTNTFQVATQYEKPGVRAGVGAQNQQPAATQYYSGFNTFNNFSQMQSSLHGGYPDRKYQLQEDATQIVDPALYASFVQPSVDLTPYNPSEWWKRYERSSDVDGNQSEKRKRQTAGSGSAAGTELCPTRSQFIMPRAALNSRGEWKYVVNIEQGNEKYTQLVKSETCLTSECSGICSMPNGYTSRCEQKYVQKRLVALEGTGSQLYTDIFWFPHCCICQIAPDIR